MFMYIGSINALVASAYFERKQHLRIFLSNVTIAGIYES